ncbi:MAG: DUF11 domain-containing protein, partial [Thermoplasmata archaeon]|nr:DUF11 domain-containing protein [Thermoplasmata archaeon]
DGFELILTEDENDELDELELGDPEDEDLDDLLTLDIDDVSEEDEVDEDPLFEIDEDQDELDLLKGFEPELADMEVLKELESDLEIPGLDARKEDKKGISKDFLSRWARLGDEPEEDMEEEITPSLTSKEFFTQLMETEDEDDGGLPDFVDLEMDIGEVIVLEDLDALNSKIEADPDNDELYARKARLLAKAGSFEDAIANYDKAAELNVDKEEEYKRCILEILQGSDLSTSDDELDELELDTFKQETEETKARLAEIDEDLALFPSTESLLQEKGELLDKLGMHEAALECYDLIIQSSYKEIEATSHQKAHGEKDSLQTGMVNGQGRVNGRGMVNGRTNGRVNGMAIGRVNGRVNGKVNGLVNGRGMVNGRTNGLTNGKVNGLINGHGLVNGRGMVNGRTNGLTNGKVNGLINGHGLVNGRGMVNGRTNGKVNGQLSQLGLGGLINGMGLINGDGLASGHSRLKGQKAKFRSTAAWRMRITMMALLIFIMMFVPVLTNVMISDETYGMNIDGNFADWREFQEYHDSPIDQITNEDINIISSKINFKPPNLYFYLQVEGDILGGVSNGNILGMDTIFIFIDSDADPSTGYSISNMGADILLDVHGWSNSISRLEVHRFETGMSQNDWNGFTFSHTGIGAIVHGELELRVVLNELNSQSQPIMLITTQDSFGRMDISDSMIAPLHGTLRAIVTEAVEDDVLDQGEHDASLIRLEAFGRRTEISSMTFNLAGELELEDMDNMRLVMDSNGNRVIDLVGDVDIPSTLEPNGREFTLAFDSPMTIEAGETQDMFLVFDVAVDTLAQNVGVKLSDIEVSSGTIVHIAVNAGAIHNIGTPASITIDGAFGDWEYIDQNIDSANDVMSGSLDFNTSLINRNVDISDYRMMVDDRLLVYTSVAGVAMGGVDIPMIRYRHIVTDNDTTITPPPPPVDSDNDGVPDVLDGIDGNMAHDFNNDGIPDADSQGDLDGDGITDYTNGGTDHWLNTIIPDDYDANYSGMEVVRYIGPVQHEEKKGLDYLSVYIDSDNDQSTGAYVKGMVGADHLILISGRNNNILTSEIYTYIPGLENPWELLDDINAALDYQRMEMGIPLSLIGLTSIDEFSIYIEISDWKHSLDLSDDTIVHDTTYTGGTRSAPNDNEIYAKPPPVPDLSVSKSADLRDAEPGDIITYTIEVTNKRGAANIASLWVNDTLPSGVTYISDTSGLTPTINGDTYTYPYSNLAGNTAITFTITVQVDSDAPDGDLINTVDVDHTDENGVYYG